MLDDRIAIDLQTFQKNLCERYGFTLNLKAINILPSFQFRLYLKNLSRKIQPRRFTVLERTLRKMIQPVFADKSLHCPNRVEQ